MKNMKKWMICAALSIVSTGIRAQDTDAKIAASTVQEAVQDSDKWIGTLYNKEYDVYFRIDFYHQNITIPGQSIFGEMPGYFGDYKDGRKWLITGATVDKNGIAHLSITNDYGSEDLEATLEKQPEGTYLFKQENGSDMKIARNRKWQKLPKKMEFIKR